MNFWALFLTSFTLSGVFLAIWQKQKTGFASLTRSDAVGTSLPSTGPLVNGAMTQNKQNTWNKYPE